MAFQKENFELLHSQFENLKLHLKNNDICSELQPNWDNSDVKQMFTCLTSTLQDQLDKLETNEKHYKRIMAMLGCLYYQQAKILVDLHENKLALLVLQTALDLLKTHILSPEITFLGFRIINHYCYLISKQEDYEKAQELLEFSEQVYKELKDNGDISQRNLFSNDDLFNPSEKLSPNKEVVVKFERLVTNNLQMLAYVYHKQEKMEQFAVYHHEVLKRQLDMRDSDAMIWASKAARLGYFFMTNNQFAQARHHISAACYVLSQYENTLNALESSELVNLKWEELNRQYAEIAKCWVKFGLHLFNVSKFKKMFSSENSNNESIWENPLGKIFHNKIEDCGLWIEKDELKSSSATTNFTQLPEKTPDEKPVTSSSSIEEMFKVIFENKSSDATCNDLGDTSFSCKVELEEPLLVFPTLDLSCFENCVSSTVVSSLPEARNLFNFTHSWLKKSREFYTIKDHPMEFVMVILDLSELYRYLAFYEDSVDNQYIVHKRRADTLESMHAVLKEVKPPCHIPMTVELLRELAEVQLELMSLNLKRIYQSHAHIENTQETISDFLNQQSEHTLRKMGAIADLHLHLEELGDGLAHSFYDEFHSTTQSVLSGKDEISGPSNCAD